MEGRLQQSWTRQKTRRSEEKERGPKRLPPKILPVVDITMRVGEAGAVRGFAGQPCEVFGATTEGVEKTFALGFFL
jgi:hypothetical protein